MLPSKVGTSILGNLTPLVIVAGDSVDGLGMTPGVRVNSNLSCRLQSKTEDRKKESSRMFHRQVAQEQVAQEQVAQEQVAQEQVARTRENQESEVYVQEKQERA